MTAQGKNIPDRQRNTEAHDGCGWVSRRGCRHGHGSASQEERPGGGVRGVGGRAGPPPPRSPGLVWVFFSEQRKAKSGSKRGTGVA